MIIYKNTKLFPLGSACFINASLSQNKKLRQYKIYKSPFNGTRILTNEGILPIQVFIQQTSYFKSIYCDLNNWQIINDNDDIQGYNKILNIRRCHLKKDNEFSFIYETENAFNYFYENSKNLILLIDLTDYIIFTYQQLKNMKECLNAYKTVYFIRDLQIDSARRSINKISNLQIQFDIKNKLEEISNIFNIIHIMVPSKAANNEVIQYMSEIYSNIFEIYEN